MHGNGSDSGTVTIITDGEIVLHIAAGMITDDVLRERRVLASEIARQVRHGGVAAILDLRRVSCLTDLAASSMKSHMRQIREAATMPHTDFTSGAIVFVVPPDGPFPDDVLEEMVAGPGDVHFQVKRVERMTEALFWLHSLGYSGFDSRESLERIADAEQALLASIGSGRTPAE